MIKIVATDRLYILVLLNTVEGNTKNIMLKEFTFCLFDINLLLRIVHHFYISLNFQYIRTGLWFRPLQQKIPSTSISLEPSL
jgi:hypothetical protein